MTIDIQKIKADILSLNRDLTEHSGITQKTINLAKSLFLVLNNQETRQQLLQELNKLEELALAQMHCILCERALEGTTWSSFFHTLSAIYNYITSGFDTKYYASNTDQLLSIMSRQTIEDLAVLMRYKTCIAVMHEMTGDNRSSSFTNMLQRCLGMSPLAIATRQVAKIKEACCKTSPNKTTAFLESEDMLKYAQRIPISLESPLSQTLAVLNNEYKDRAGGISEIVDNICKDCKAAEAGERTAVMTKQQQNWIAQQTFDQNTSEDEKIAAWWVEMQYRVVCAAWAQENSQRLFGVSVKSKVYLAQECNWKEGCASQNPLVQAFAITSNIAHSILCIDEPLPYCEDSSQPK